MLAKANKPETPPKYSSTYPWSESGEIRRALLNRGYSFRLGQAGLTVEWDDDELTVEELRAGIDRWIEEDRRAASMHRKLPTRERRPDSSGESPGSPPRMKVVRKEGRA